MLPDPRTPPPMPEAPPSSSGSFSAAVRMLVSSCAGAVIAVAAGFLVTDGERVASAWRYALACALISGCALGIVVAALTALAVSQRRRGRSSIAGVISAVAPAAVFIWLNAGTFSGNWVRTRSWAPLAAWALRVLGALGVVVGLMALRRLERAALRWRTVAAMVGVAGAVAFAWVELNRFGAYPWIKLQLILGAWIAASAAARLLLAGFRTRPTTEAVLVLLALGAAIAAQAGERGRPDAHAIRSAIANTPIPVAAESMTAAEWLLSPYAPIERPRRAAAAEPISVDPVYDAGEVARVLDARLPGRRNLNVLWLAVDALRADHIHAYGYPRETSPNIDAFARQSSWFRRAISPAPASAAGYSSLMTGLFARVTPAYAAEYGVKFPVPADFSVPSRLALAGRQTIGVTAFYKIVQDQPPLAASKAGFAVMNPGHRDEELRANEVTDQGLALMRQYGSEGSRPFFLWLHYMEPHAPYYFHQAHDFGRTPKDVYDGEIAFADEQIGRLFAEMAKLGLDKNTIVVLFGDHGEGFGEHNNREHGSSLHDHQVRVPLMIRIPGLPPQTFDSWVSLSDVSRTTLSLVGVEDGFQRLGRDLTPLIAGVRCAWPDAAYAERTAEPARWPRSWERAVWSGDRKLIWKPHANVWESYDLRADPGELRDIFDENDAEAQRLLALLDAFDAKIDAYWNGDRPSNAGDERGSLKKRFEALVDRLEADDGSAFGTLVTALMKIIESPAIEQEESRKPLLGQDALRRMSEVVVRRMPALPPDSPLHLPLLHFLAFMNDPARLPFVREQANRITVLEARFAAAAYMAEHGMKEVLPELRIALEGGLIETRILAASALASLGDPSGTDVLRMALDVEWHPGIVRRAIDGLARLGDPTPIERMLNSWREIWANTWVQRGLEQAAERLPPTPDTGAALLHLMNGSDPIAAPAARAAFDARFGAGEQAHAARVFEAIVGARTALMYHDAATAVASFRDLGEADDAMVGSGWWLLVRAARESGNRAECERGIARLRAAGPRRPEAEAELARLLAGLETRPAESAPSVLLTARQGGGAALPAMAAGQMFHARFVVTNASGRYLPGGESLHAPQLQWRFKDADGTFVPAPRVIFASLPSGGLRAGESTDLDVLGILPPIAASYSAVLTYHLLQREEPVIVPLFALPPAEVKAGL